MGVRVLERGRRPEHDEGECRVAAAGVDVVQPDGVDPRHVVPEEPVRAAAEVLDRQDVRMAPAQAEPLVVRELPAEGQLGRRVPAADLDREPLARPATPRPPDLAGAATAQERLGHEPFGVERGADGGLHDR